MQRFQDVGGRGGLLFLGPLDVHQHAVEKEYALFQRSCLFGDLTGFGWSFPPGLALNHDVKVD